MRPSTGLLDSLMGKQSGLESEPLQCRLVTRGATNEMAEGLRNYCGSIQARGLLEKENSERMRTRTKLGFFGDRGEKEGVRGVTQEGGQGGGVGGDSQGGQGQLSTAAGGFPSSGPVSHAGSYRRRG